MNAKGFIEQLGLKLASGATALGSVRATRQSKSKLAITAVGVKLTCRFCQNILGELFTIPRSR